MACDNTPYFIVENDTIKISKVVTPNNDGFNDFIMFFRFDTISNNFPIKISILDRYENLVFTDNDYKNNWPTYIPSQGTQNIEGISNGLYKFIFLYGTEQVEGYLVIILFKDDYLDKHIYEIPCFDYCMFHYFEDPFLIF